MKFYCMFPASNILIENHGGRDNIDYTQLISSIFFFCIFYEV